MLSIGSSARPVRPAGQLAGRLLIGAFAAIAVMLGTGGTASAVDPAPVNVVTGVAGTLSELAISADGAWRVAVEKNASAQKVAVWRSSNATTWTRIVLPAGVTSGAVGILTNGNVVIARGNGTNAQLYKYTTSWSTATTIGALTSGEVAAIAIASGTTPTIVAVASQGSVFSSIAGGTWATSTLTGVGTIGSVGLIGTTYVHIVGSAGYVRWSTSTRAQVGTVNATITTGQVMSAPSSTTTLYAVSGGTGSFTVRKTTDSGATWTVLASAVPVPYRAGVTFGSPRVLSDGTITIYGSVLESGNLTVYSTGWAPATATWGTVRRSPTTLTSGTLAIWPTQRVAGTQPASAERWVTQSTGSPATTSAWYLAGTGDPAGWATTTQTVSGTSVLTGVSGSLGSPVRSPSGTWRAMIESDGPANLTWFAAVWRSSDGVTWQRVPLPQVEPSVVASVSDAGVVTLVDTNGVSRSWQFVGGEWIGPVVVSVSGGSTPQAVVSDGTTLVITASNGTLNYSIDSGTSWSAGQSTGLSSISNAAVIGGYVHLSGSSGYRRWSFATKVAVDSVVPNVFNATVMSAPASTSNLWATFTASTSFYVWKSVDAGVTWSTVSTAELMPYRTGATFASPVVASDGKIHLFGSAVESGTSAVYESVFDPATTTWSTVQRAPTTVASGSLLIWPTQKVNGTQTTVARWLVRAVGSPATYSVTDVSTGNVANPWPTTTQTAVGQTMLAGVTGALELPVFSPTGTWRAVLEHGDSANPTWWAAAWRSSDGLTWQRVPLPNLMYSARIMVSDNGAIGLADQNGFTRYEVFTAAGDWFGGTQLPVLNATLTGLVSDGSTPVMTFGDGTVNYSLNAGAGWLSQTTGLSSINVATAIGGYVHLSGTGGYRHWSFTTKGVTDTIVASVAYATVWSTPGSTSDLWATQLSPGALTTWHSTNSGTTWTIETTSEGMPYRPGAAFGYPVIGADAKVHLFGSAVEAGTVAAYELIWDPVAKAWSTVQRRPTSLASGALVVWPTQRLNGSQGPIARWAISGTAPRTALDVSTGYIASPWSTTQTATTATILTGVVGLLDYPSMSPNGAWRLVEEHTTNTSQIAAVWRSSDGIAWQRVPMPDQIEQPGPIAIGNDGTVLVLRSVAAGTVLASSTTSSYSFEGGEWRGPRFVDASGGWNELARVLRSDGSTWMALTDYARVLYSTDGGKTWSSGGNIGAGGTFGTATTVDVVGNIAHAFGGNQYSRWSFTTHAPLTFPVAGNPVVISGYPTGGRILVTPGSTSDIWMAWGGGSLNLRHSTDSGATWSSETSEALPYGMGSNNFEVAQDGNIHFYSVATCSSARLVYSASHPLAATTGWSQTMPMFLDESVTATLIDPPHGALAAPTPTIDAWFNTGASPAVDLIRTSGVLASPESVFGFHGYGLSADGVSTEIGSFAESHTDVAIAGVGPKLGLTRTYNSADRRIGIFGRGWTSSFEKRAYENCATKDVTILHGDGRRETYYWDGTSGYFPSPGSTATLAKIGTTGWTLTDPDGTVDNFRSDGRLTSEADADGQIFTLTWNGSNQLTTVTDAVSGRYLTLTYTAGLVTSVSTQPVTINGVTAPLTWNYAYSGNNLSKVCEPRNNNTTTGYCITYTSLNNRIEIITDANGHIDRKIGYTGNKVAWEENGTADRTVFAYPTSQKTIVTDPNGHTVTNEFDNRYRTTKVTDAAGGTTLYGYDSNGFKNSTTDQNNNTTSQVLDVRGNILSETNALGKTTYFAYDSYNNRTQLRDARSTSSVDSTFLVSSVWDSPKRLKLSETTPPTAQQPTGTTRLWAYTNGTEAALGGGLTPAGLLKSETDAKGSATTYVYDSLGNLRRATDRLGLVTEFAYDQLGREISQTQYPSAFPAGVTTTYDLDQIGDIVAQTDPATTNAITGLAHRRKVTNTYDPAGRQTQSVESDIAGSASPDPSRTTVFGYDHSDRPTTVTDPEGGVTTKVYDPAGNMIDEIDQLGRHRVTAFNSRNLPISVTAQMVVKDEGAPTFRDVVVQQLTYDPAGRQTSITDARGVVTEIGYDAANRTTSKTLKNYHNRNGTTRDIALESTTYDAAGNPTTIVTGNGLRSEQLAYDPAGVLTSTTLDPTGLNRTVAVVYDKNGNATSTTVSDATRSEQTVATFDAGDNVLSTTVENGATDLVTTYTYDNRGIVTSTVEPRGNAAGGTPANYRVDFTLDVFGNTTTTQSPPVTVVDNGTTTIGVRPTTTTGYDTYGNATHTRDERNNTTVYLFDRLARNTQITHPSYTDSSSVTVTPIETFVYDPVGNLTSRTDRRGFVTTFTYDGLNRAITQTDPPLGLNPPGITSMYYDDSGHVVTSIDQRGARSEATFDDLGRQRTSTSVVRNGTPTPDRDTTTSDYDDLSNPNFTLTPTGSTYSATYNAAGEPLQSTDPLGYHTTLTHDVAGRVTSEIDALGRRTDRDYDLAGRQIAVRRYSPTAVLLTTTTAAYDDAGNQISTTSPRGNVGGANPTAFTTNYTYDALSRPTSVVQAITSSTSTTTNYAYDAAGNQTALTDGRASTTSYRYNTWNLQTDVIEPVTTAHPASSDRTWTTDYDAGGLPTKTIEPGGVVVNRTFDELGQLTSEAGSGPNATAATRTLGYDAAGFTTSASSPAGTIGLAYDDRGLLTTTTGPSQYASSFIYDPAGRMTSRTDGAGTTAFTWGPRDELATITDPLTTTTQTLTFDPTGQLSTVTYGTGATRTVGYDQLARIVTDELRTAASVVTASYGYGYDEDGNVTSRTVNLPGNASAGTNAYTYDNAGRLTSWTKPDTTTATYTWDNAGNLTSNGGVATTYDQRNRIIATGSTTYTWTPRGSLLQTDKPGDPGPKSYSYDGLDRAILSDGYSYTYDSLDRIASASGTTFGYAGTEIDPVVADQLKVARTPAGNPVATRAGVGAATLVGRDRHGDIGYHYQPDATVVGTRVYDPFGAAVTQTGSTTALGFQGDYTAASGDVWMGARWYRPGTGNFVSHDTYAGELRTPISLNRYTYASANPLNLWDPDGHAGNSVDAPAVNFAGADCTNNYGGNLAPQCFAAQHRNPDGSCASDAFAVGDECTLAEDFGDAVNALANDKLGQAMSPVSHFVDSLANTVLSAVTTPLKMVTELTACTADAVSGVSGPGCFNTLSQTASETWHAVTNPLDTLHACADSLASCAGGIVGGYLVGKIAPDGPLAAIVDKASPILRRVLDLPNRSHTKLDPPNRPHHTDNPERAPPGRSMTTNNVSAYEVGTYDDLVARSVKGDGIEIHHAMQDHASKQLIDGASYGGGPAIALARAEHRLIPNLKGEVTLIPREVLARDAWNLRRYTNAPNSAIQDLIALNKATYPGALAK